MNARPYITEKGSKRDFRQFVVSDNLLLIWLMVLMSFFNREE